TEADAAFRERQRRAQSTCGPVSQFEPRTRTRHHQFDDREAEAASTGLLPRASYEPAFHLLDLLGWDPRAVIAHDDFRSAGAGLDIDFDRATARRVIERILHQVAQCQRQRSFLDKYFALKGAPRWSKLHVR